MLKIMGDRIQLTEDKLGMERLSGGSWRASSRVQFQGREVGHAEKMRLLAWNIRGLSQVNVEVPVVSDLYAYAGWCRVLQADATYRQFTAEEGSFPGTGIVEWRIYLERFEGGQELRLIGTSRTTTDNLVGTPQIGLPKEAIGAFWPSNWTGGYVPEASTEETFAGQTFEFYNPTLAEAALGVRYDLSAIDGHLGQVKLDVNGSPIVGTGLIRNTPNRIGDPRDLKSWSISNGIIEVGGPSTSGIFTIRNLKFGTSYAKAFGWKWSDVSDANVPVTGNIVGLPSFLWIRRNNYFSVTVRLTWETPQVNVGSRVHFDITIFRGSPFVLMSGNGVTAVPNTTGWTAASTNGHRKTQGSAITQFGTADGAITDIDSRPFYIIQDDNADRDTIRARYVGHLDQWVNMVHA